MKTMTGIRHNNAPKYHDERSNNENYFNGLLLGTLFPDFSLLGVDEDGDILPSHWRPRFLNLSIGEFSELNFFLQVFTTVLFCSMIKHEKYFLLLSLVCSRERGARESEQCSVRIPIENYLKSSSNWIFYHYFL